MLSIIYVTFTNDNHLHDFITSISQSASQPIIDQIQIVIVDGLLNENSPIHEKERRKQISGALQPFSDYIHVSIKPNPWQGKYRIAKDTYLNFACARNTGICFAKHDYVAFVNDNITVSAVWLSCILTAMSFQKIQYGPVHGSTDNTPEPNPIKNLFEHHPENGFKHGVFCMPKNIYLTLNGMDERYDGCSDAIAEFVSRITEPIFYNKFMESTVFTTSYETQMSRFIYKNPSKIINGQQVTMIQFLKSTPAIPNTNPEFSLQTYTDQIMTRKINPKQVFKLVATKPHFFTNKPFSMGL